MTHQSVSKEYATATSPESNYEGHFIDPFGAKYIPAIWADDKNLEKQFFL